jgi:hypothetical protein
MLSSFSVQWLKVMVMVMATGLVVLIVIGVVQVQHRDVEQMLRAQVL